MTRLHKGKDYELFIWRDLCGRLQQTTEIKAPRWAKWKSAAWSGSIITWLNSNQPVSNEAERIWDDNAFFYEWGFNVPGIGDVNMQYQISFLDPMGELRIDMSATWGSQHAEADRTWSDYTLVPAVPPMFKQMDWDHRHSTNNAAWNWGVGGVTSTLWILAQGYPYP